MGELSGHIKAHPQRAVVNDIDDGLALLNHRTEFVLDVPHFSSNGGHHTFVVECGNVGA